jgi:hypothetical protein
MGKGKGPEKGRNLKNWDEGYADIIWSFKRDKKNTERNRYKRGNKNIEKH